MLFPDHTDDKKLTTLLREMRRYNPIANKAQYGTGYRNFLVSNMVEDPNFRFEGRQRERGRFRPLPDECYYPD